MMAKYKPTVWKDEITDASGNLVQSGTPLSANNLNKLEAGMVQVDEKVDGFATQLADKASNNQLEIEKNRIDNLIANAGETGNNAELLDIRVGMDGTTYRNAGEAVRAIEEKVEKSKDQAIEYVDKYLSEEETVSSGINRIISEKPKKLDLFFGNETKLTVTGASISNDSNYHKLSSKGLRITTAGATTASVIKELNGDASIFHSVCIWVYIEDVSKLTDLVIRLIDEKPSESVYSKTHLTQDGKGFKNGWNLLRFRTTDGVGFSENFGKVMKLRILPITSAATSIVIGGLWVERYEKAKIIFIHDGGYSDFFDENNKGYIDLKRRNMPVTIATIPKKIDDDSNTLMISKSRLYELSLENNNEISIHSYDGQDSIATMSQTELKEESFKAVSMLKNWGYNPLWRAAWFRNNAPGAMGSTGLFYAFAYHGALSRVERVEGFPFPAMYNVRRYQLHNRTPEILDKTFALLKKTSGVLVSYTHSVVDNSLGDINEADWDYFLRKLDSSVQEGWLEGTTFKDLIQPYLGDGVETTFTKRRY